MTAIIHAKQSLPLPPGSLGLPIIGETISYLRSPNFFEKRQQQYGLMFKTHLFGRPAVVMIGAEANRFIFTNEKQYFSGGWPASAQGLLGAGSLVIQTGDEHQKHRKLLTQAFQHKALAEYAITIEDITYSYLHKWERMGTFDWSSELRKYTFDIACKLFVSIDAASDSGIEELFEKWGKGLLSVPVRLPWTKFSQALRCREQLLQRIEEILQKRQQQPQLSQDALGILLQAQDDDGNSLSREVLKDQVLTLLAGGHKTLISSLTSFCLLLAQHPEVLQAIRAEQQQLAFEGPLTLDCLKQMTYLEQVLKEVLRLIPPVDTGFRQVSKPFDFNGYFIPQGWFAVYQVSRTHQDSSIYAQPECFDPQRFALERSEDKRKPCSHIPFGGGTRECIGKELAKLQMKLFAALLVRDYEWELLPNQNLDLVFVPMTYLRYGLKVKFRRLMRHDN